jgi:hypothetical protein
MTVGFRMGGESGEYVRVTLTGRSIPQATDYWDGNWLGADVEVHAGGFSGRFPAYFRVEEVQSFRDQVASLHQTLSGTATFEPMEEQLRLRLEGDGKGHIDVEGQARDVVRTGNMLTFELSLDQTYLPELVRSLDQTLTAFPVRGEPAA